VLFPPEEGSGAMKDAIVKSMVLKLPPEPYKETDYPFFMR